MQICTTDGSKRNVSDAIMKVYEGSDSAATLFDRRLKSKLIDDLSCM